MSIFVVIGINHRTASVELREKIYFEVDKLSLYLQDILAVGDVREAVLLSTCNRSELYCHAEDAEGARAWFLKQTQMPSEALTASLYVHKGEAAIAHILQVACGLDSMILGEPQILGQMKAAFAESCTAGAVDALFHRLFQQVFALAKDIRTTTAIGACPVSVASAAVHFAKQQMGQFKDVQIALVGAGDTTELLLRYLTAHVSAPILLINRSLDNAEVLATTFGCRAYSLDQLSTAMAEADIVFSATGSAVPLINQAITEKAMQRRRNRPLMLMDIAVPRDIEPNVDEIDNVSLYCIDDLKQIIEHNKQGREHAADKARELIRRKAQVFLQEVMAHDKVSYTIRAYRTQVEAICRIELNKAKQQLKQGEDPALILELFAHALTKKLLHAPSAQLRQAGAEGRLDILHLAKQLFAIPDPEAECL